MEDNMNVTQDEGQVLDSEDVLDPDEQDDVFYAEIEDDGEEGYELTDEEIMELADEEDEEDAFSDQDGVDVEDSDEQDDADSDAAPPDESEAAPDGQEPTSDGEDGAVGEGEGSGGEQSADPSTAAPVDYDAMAKQDLEAITRAFPGIGITDLRRIDNPGRYGALREMGLTPEEAFRATNGNRISAHAAASARARADGKSHIRGDMPAKQASAEGFSMTATQLREYRELFPDKSDKEITELVRSVSKRK